MIDIKYSDWTTARTANTAIANSFPPLLNNTAAGQFQSMMGLHDT
jgi:hypothetical protein